MENDPLALHLKDSHLSQSQKWGELPYRLLQLHLCIPSLFLKLERALSSDYWKIMPEQLISFNINSLLEF